MIFCEIFAGKGVLTKAVEELSMKAETPDDFQHGGTDFRSSKQVEALKSKLAKLAAQANHLVVHLAPPCATFSSPRSLLQDTASQRLVPGGVARQAGADEGGESDCSESLCSGQLGG